MGDNSESSFQRITKGFSKIFWDFLPFLKKTAQLKAVTTTPSVAVHSSFTMTDVKHLQSLPKISDIPATMAAIDSYQLPEVNFGLMRRELLVANPELAAMALRVFRHGALTRSQWSLDNIRIPPLQHCSGNTQPRTSDNFDQGKHNMVNPSSGHAMLPFAGFSRTYLPQSNGALQIIPMVNFGAIKNDLAASFPSFAMIPTKPMHAPEEFHCFKKLPLELQIEIWKLAVADVPPRVVSLRCDKPDIPGVIQACKISRRESKKKFRFCVSRSEGKRPKLYPIIDLKKDTLYLPVEPVEGILEDTSLQSLARSFKNCLPNVTHLALDLDVAAAAVSPHRLASDTYLWKILSTVCPALQVLQFVTKSPTADTKEAAIKRVLSAKVLFFKRIMPAEVNAWPQNSKEKAMIGLLQACLFVARHRRGICEKLDFQVVAIPEV